MPVFVHNTLPKPLLPIMDKGIVYHVYTQNRCVENPRYIKEVERNSAAVKAKDSQAKIALITNCDVPSTTAKYIDIIVPIHSTDVIKTAKKQWLTRVLYNAYLPFNYSFITDTHVYPCDNKSYYDIFDLYKKSNVDISFSCRVNYGPIVSGGAVLSKWGNRSYEFWIRTYKLQQATKNWDDQYPMLYTFRKYKNTLFSVKWLSSNYFYASHGINEYGKFKGPATCYRSSIVVTGAIRWVHGSPFDCYLMNGKKNEYTNIYRSYFRSGTCNTTLKGQRVITSDDEMKRAVYPYEAPLLKWDVDKVRRPSEGIFWQNSNICLTRFIDG